MMKGSLPVPSDTHTKSHSNDSPRVTEGSRDYYLFNSGFLCVLARHYV